MATVVVIAMAAGIGAASADPEWQYSADQGWNLEEPYERSGQAAVSPYEGDDYFAPYYGGYAKVYSVNDYKQREPSGGAAERPRKNTTAITGKLSEFQVLEASAGSDKLLHLVMDNGRSYTIDWGPDVSASDLALRSGARVTVIGERRTDGNRTVIAASCVNIGGVATPLR